MSLHHFRQFCVAALLAWMLGATVTNAADVPAVIVGKDNWLFTGYEFAHVADQPDTRVSLDLLQKTNKLLADRGIALAIVIVPSKIRIYADQLPANVKLDAYTAEKYERMTAALRSNGVNVVDLNQAFLNSPLRLSETPFFLQLDTHWAPSGALAAAEAVRAEIDKNPLLKSAWAATPEAKYRLAWFEKKTPHRARDLVRFLPKEAQNYPFEQIRVFRAVRENVPAADLLGSGENVGITVMGSSYSNKSTGYPDALRVTLQRNVLDLTLPGDHGPWVGLEAYLRDESFKTSPPKLIIWEIPEREMRSPPNYKFREARYIIGNDEWYARIVELLKPVEKP
jgi:alginate O-acetyltransferase complex protein AlgJ